MKDLGWNLGYVDDLYARYVKDPSSVSEAWQEFFADYPGDLMAVRVAAELDDDAGDTAQPAAETTVAPEPITVEESPEEASEPAGPEEEAITGIAARIVENMETSLSVPTATSARTVPVKLLEENRRIINQHQAATFRPKVSYTHLIAWAILRGLAVHPSLNDGYRQDDGKPVRIRRRAVNLGLAIDIEKRGERVLLVPNIKDAGSLGFAEFLDAYNAIIVRARSGKLTIEDFQETSVTLTNPGMIGTVLSVPRLMAGQGAIFGAGNIGYPPEFSGLSPESASQIGLSKVMTLTSTYDHRIVQGAESGGFLAVLEKLLLGGENFYERIFADLGVPHEPLSWSADDAPPIVTATGRHEATAKQAQVLQLINAYRIRGHTLANVDPLGTAPEAQPELELYYYGLSVWDLDRKFLTGGLAGDRAPQTLRSILETLRQTYCAYVGVQYIHNPSLEEREWLQERMESTRNSEPLDTESQLRILRRLNAAEAFERFLHATYVGHKRFSLEGCETLIPVLDRLFSDAADDGVREAVLGMAHRGRLNVLGNIVGKSLEKIFGEFEEADPESTQGSGDVKYHFGATGAHASPAGSEIEVTIASNPSHLESVNPVVEGMARARYQRLEERSWQRVLPVLIHGDAAFAGQGVVTETLNLSQLRGYHTGGTVHIVINNQIGFTTRPQDARSSPYATDVAKTVGAPIIHVNADQPEAAVRMVRLALEFRQKFHRDVVLDLVCYRRWGHNEGDEPTYTQPIMYERIKDLRSVRKLYTENLLRRGEIDLETAESLLEDFQRRLDEAFAAVKTAREEQVRPEPQPDLESTEGAVRPHVETGVAREHLEEILRGLVRVPEEFEPHAKLMRQLERRNSRFAEDRIEWGLAESLAFGSIVTEGKHVRISGQDSGRATFSQRHAILYDKKTAESHVPLQHLSPAQGEFSVYDSSLSEFAVLGFEYGYSVEMPEALVMWEAQFGDFVNCAQVIIDQFISSAEEKWSQTCSLVLLLPHGYEGQGPEHSSARLERFLQLTSEGNMQVAYPTTPAQYFHLLRRQVMRDEHKPLVVMTPKSLLRLPAATSAVAELTTGHFRETIDDADADPDSVKRVLLACGKVYYDLSAFRAENGHDDAALVRIEQLYPFPSEQLREILARYSNADSVIWVQEEPRNMGAWDFLDARVVDVLSPGQSLYYVGRPWSASPASGSHLRHQAEQEMLVKRAFEEVHQPSRVS